MRTALLVLSVAAVSAATFNFSDSALVQDALDFGYGFTLGFTEIDVKSLEKCEFTYQNATDRVHAIAADVGIMQSYSAEQSAKDEALRDILHILERLPEDTATCSDMSTILEQIASRLVTLLNIVDLATTVTKNLALHSVQIGKDLAQASGAIAIHHYFNAGYYFGRAMDLVLS